MRKNVRQIHGFTIIETIIAVALLSTVVTTIVVQAVSQHNRQLGQVLAKQTKQYASLFAAFIADLKESNVYIMDPDGQHCMRLDPFTKFVTNTYVLTLDDLKNNNYGQYTNSSVSDSSILFCTPNKTNYWNDLYSGQNNFKQQPCLGVTKDSAGRLHSFLFWANVGTSAVITPEIARNAALALNGAGGYVKNGMVVGNNWSVPISDARFSGNCPGRIGNNSVVLNLDQYMVSNDELNPPAFIARESDTLHDVGSIRNQNTAQTDIVMNGESIIFDGANKIVLSSQGKNVKVSGTLQATALSAVEAVDSGFECSRDEVGAIKRQQDVEAQQLGVQVANEICSYSPVICRLYVHSDYCYLPTKKSTIRFTDFAHTGKLGTSRECPKSIPFMKGATAWQENGSPTTQDIIYTFNGYNIIHGAQAVSDPNAGCLIWSFDVNIRDEKSRLWDCHNKVASKECNAGTDFVDKVCLGNYISTLQFACDGSNSKATNWKCVKPNPTPVFLETMICSNKYFIDQQ